MKNYFLNDRQGGYTHTLTKKSLVCGYTIIETMIAISLFLIIVMAGMGALLNANLLHQKSQDMRSIIDSLSFVMEDISRNLRTGYDYHCIDDGNIAAVDPHSCAFGAGISFKSSLDDSQWVYYEGENAEGKIGIFKSTDGGITTMQITSDEVEIDIDASFFSVSGAEPPPGDTEQPLVIIKLVGTIIYKDIVTPFSLQTAVSQRQIDV